MITRLNHATFYVLDQDSAHDFYVNKLGFKVHSDAPMAPGFGVFECKDIYATYEELKAKGVEFTKEPKEEFYGVEALFKDDSGNWFSLGQKK